MRRLGALTVIGLSVLASMTACGDDKGSVAAFDGCRLVSRPLAAEATGSEITRTEDESSHGVSEAAFIGCRYLTEGAGAPALVIDARRANNQAKTANDIVAARSACNTAQPLDADGVTGFVCETGGLAGGPQAYATWDGSLVHVALTTAKNSPKYAETVTHLTTVVGAVHTNLAASAFEPK